MYNLFEQFNESPIIAAVSDINKLNAAIESPCKIIFLLSGNIFNLKEISNRIKSQDKSLFINIDSIDGFSKDTWGLEYIVKNIILDGIITEKSNLIKLCKDMGVFNIQRLQITNTSSLNNAINSIKKIRPSMVEILPGIMPKIIKQIIEETKISVIASGLITDKNDLDSCIDSGAMAISTSSKYIWYL